MTRRLARIAAVRRIYSLEVRLHKLSLRQYLSWYFSPSTQHDIVHNHRPKLFNSNWTQLKHLIIQLAREDGRDARGRINNWISNQSDSILVKEMKRTKPAFVSSHDMAPEVLASDQIDARLDATVESNSFISGRIRNLLSHCGDPPPVEESNCDKLSSDFTDVDMEDAQEDSSGSDAERGCFKEQHVSFLCRSIMGQIAFACNRRNNAMQHRNGLMALACGANDRLTTFLFEPDNGQSGVAEGDQVNPLLPCHNIDVAHHVNGEHPDRRSELLHGTFGYAHVQNGDVANAYDLQAYIAHQALLPPVDVNLFLPAEASEEAFATGFSAQMYRALARLLKMMDESDTSTADVAKLSTVCGCNSDSRRKNKRTLYGYSDVMAGPQCLSRWTRDYNYRVPGVAHLQWIEISRSLFITANLLGRKGLDPQKIKDYNPMERLLQDTAQLELQTHLTGLDVAIMKVFDRYLHSDAVQRAKVNMEKAPVFYESLLRLRDLVDFEEAYYATLQGDIGRLIHCWERMFPFLQAAEGVSHYRTHLPHLLLLLKSSPNLSTKRSPSFLPDRKGDSLNSLDGDRRGVPLTGVGVCTGMVDHEGGSDVVDWRCGPKVRPVRPGWLIHVGAKNRPSGSVREPAPS
ncbi:BQ5605_C003g02084 [Microbotryum silenes-dioicae]|uniref:BQ5605_C003g02084 protein n=1 Tax=Microbotryum silenes-dioicae TaxID=796604 RepID=A0A2X0M472_9BASI|nr:BQ5605_C003g02084 [Microbotryum silenes-dioicae]